MGVGVNEFQLVNVINLLVVELKKFNDWLSSHVKLPVEVSGVVVTK